MRLLALSEALTGFGFISLAVTLLGLPHRRPGTQACRGPLLLPSGPPRCRRRRALSPPFVAGRFSGLESIFANAARDLQGLLENHIEHPLIHYFHPPACAEEFAPDVVFGAGVVRGHSRLSGQPSLRGKFVGTRSCEHWRKPGSWN